MAKGRETARHVLGLVLVAIRISLANNFHGLHVGGRKGTAPISLRAFKSTVVDLGLAK
jgi:hypothetical protein